MSELSSFERWWLTTWPHRLHVKMHVPQFLRACPEPFRGEVLEVGAGSGWTSQQILETFPQVELTATDLHLKSITRFTDLQKKYGSRLKVKEADVLKLPFDRASFDIVIAIYLLHFVDDIPQALRQLLRVVRPGGLIGISDTKRKYASGLTFLHGGTVLARAQLEQLLKEEECTVAVAEGEDQYIVWARKQYPVPPPV